MDRQKFNNMCFSKKIEWLLQYYGITAIVVIGAVFVIGCLLFSIFGPHSEPKIRMILLDDGVSSEDVNQIRLDLSDLLAGEADVSAYAPGDANQLQAFSVRIMADELDLVVAPKTRMEEMEENGYLTEMKPIPSGGKYFELTRPGIGEIEEDMYIGITIKKKHDESIERAINYFLD